MHWLLRSIVDILTKTFAIFVKYTYGISIPASVNDRPAMEVLQGQKILKKDGTKYTEVVIDEAFKDVHLIAYYFGGKWCDDCVKFTPLLREVYEQAKAAKEDFEVLYISSDTTEEEMKQFTQELHPDWYILYADPENDESEEFQNAWAVRENFSVWAIPSIIVLRNEEIFASLDGVADVLSKGPAVLADWKRRNIDLSRYIIRQIKPERPTENAIIPNCCRISRFKPWVNATPYEIIKNLPLMRKIKDDFVEEQPEVIKHYDIVAFYFSAHWCGPCHLFTPSLKTCYEALQKTKKSFEVIYLPNEETDEQMTSYMKSLHGDWLVTPYRKENVNPIAKKFSVQGIPSLAIINKKGELITLDATEDIRIKGPDSFPRWMEGKPGVTNEEIVAFWENENQPVEEEKTKEDEEKDKENKE